MSSRSVPDHPADYPACRCDDCEGAYIAPPRLVRALRVFLLAAAAVFAVEVLASLV